MGTIADLLDPAEQPRERLSRSGVSSLSDAELVALVLRTGCPGVAVTELARRLLSERGGLSGLVGLERSEIESTGIGPAKAASICAAIEIGCRVARAEVESRPILSHPDSVARYLYLRYRRAGQEILGALYLDSRQRPLRDVELFRGTLDRAVADPRAVIKRALLLDAKGFVVFHTHPSGDPSPSVEDLAFTRAMRGAAAAIGIHLLDHLILGDRGRWVSLRERGDLGG